MAQYKTFSTDDRSETQSVYYIEYDKTTNERVEVQETTLSYVEYDCIFYAKHQWEFVETNSAFDPDEINGEEIFIDGERDVDEVIIYCADRSLAEKIANKINALIPEEMPNYAYDALEIMHYA